MRQVVVTGGGTGIGRAVAAAFAQEGNEVIITGRRPEPLAVAAAAIGGSARAVPFDAADPEQVQRALSQLPASVDVLVNAAGGNTDIGAPEPTTLAETAAAWRANLDSNVMSAV
ncbi:MAG: SDR family NAD(P)-dependent oxidoreductase, partial [Actinobacteria bacterium]|nr:SDR family NAD(P)-dependent oxidoreductase [Actinomycetota bacterium]